MEGISDIKIDGIDENRPPNAEHKTYINIFFKLNHQAPDLWCTVFNSLMSKHPSKPNINVEEGLFIETWVKSAAEIPSHLEQLKKAVSGSIEQYIENLRCATQAASSDDDSTVDENSQQGKLNKIINALNFDV